jgi:hypothetical protein
MKTILFLIRISSFCFIGFWTIAGFISLAFSPCINCAYWDIPNEPIFFWDKQYFNLIFLILVIPAWTGIYHLNKFYKKFDWNEDLIYLTLKTITKKTSSNINKTKDQLRQGLDDAEDNKNDN